MNNFLYREFAELAYALAKADGRIKGKEIETFKQVMHEEFGDNAILPNDWFDILASETRPTIKEAYHNVFHILRMNKTEVTPELKQRYVNVLQKIAMACGGMDEREEFLIARFNEDIKSL